jgi:hypothetical protein
MGVVEGYLLVLMHTHYWIALAFTRLKGLANPTKLRLAYSCADVDVS